MSYSLHLSKTIIEKQAHQIFRLVKYKESGITVCYPGCKIDYLLTALLGDSEILIQELGEHFSQYAFIPVIFDQQADLVTLLEAVRRLGRKYGIKISQEATLEQAVELFLAKEYWPYFFLCSSQPVSPRVLDLLIRPIHQILIAYGQVGCQLFLEVNLHGEPYRRLGVTYPKLSQNEMYFPVYSPQESRDFVIAVSREYNVSLSEKDIMGLVAGGGGYLWLLREGVRLLRDGLTLVDIPSHPAMTMRLGVIAGQFTNAEKEHILGLVQGKIKHPDEIITTYLLKTEVLRWEKNKYVLPGHWLLSALKKGLTQEEGLRIDQGNIYVRGTRATGTFIESEMKILTFLSEHRGELVSRESLAEALWGEAWADKYSDWALDKAISRLRKQLIVLGLDGDILKTKKGRGFLLEADGTR